MSNDFEFKYKAPSQKERKEIESIRNSYLPKTQEKQDLETLRKLDFKVKNYPMIISLCVGILGCVVFGVGLTLCLEWDLLVWGIIVCVVSLPIMLVAYLIYKVISKKLRDKYSQKIITLSDKLLNNSQQ